jgi:hypothetical protein
LSGNATYQAVGRVIGVNSPAMASDSTSEMLNLDKEQRQERLWWVIYGVSSMLFVVCGFYMQERVELRILHTYGLTVLTYGALIYVEEFQHLRKLWLWKGVLATIPLHSVFLVGLFWWDAQAPESSGFILAYRILPFFVAEMVMFSSVIDHFKASALPDEPPRKLTRLLPWQNKPKAKMEGIITLGGESGDDSDPAKESRRNYLRWVFWGFGAILIVSYLLRGAVTSKPELYIIKVSLLTFLSYGHLLYVEEKDDLRSSWLWTTALVALPFQVALFGIIVAIDRVAPYLAPNPIAFLFIIWAFAWIETRLMDQIADDYKPWSEPSESVE